MGMALHSSFSWLHKKWNSRIKLPPWSLRYCFVRKTSEVLEVRKAIPSFVACNSYPAFGSDIRPRLVAWRTITMLSLIHFDIRNMKSLFSIQSDIAGSLSLKNILYVKEKDALSFACSNLHERKAVTTAKRWQTGQCYRDAYIKDIFFSIRIKFLHKKYVVAFIWRTARRAKPQTTTRPFS